jgi:hypothetical protein
VKTTGSPFSRKMASSSWIRGAGGWHLHGLALVHERALHIHDEERGAAGVERESDAEEVVAGHRGVVSLLVVPRTLVYFFKLYISARLAFGCASPSSCQHSTVAYQADTEKALGIWRMALTAPSSLKITETTSKRQETCRNRLSLR